MLLIDWNATHEIFKAYPQPNNFEVQWFYFTIDTAWVGSRKEKWRKWALLSKPGNEEEANLAVSPGGITTGFRFYLSLYIVQYKAIL